MALDARPRGRRYGARRAAPRRRPTRTSCPRPSRPPARARPPASGRRRCATFSAPTAPHRRGRSRRGCRREGLEELRDEVAPSRGTRPAREDPRRQARPGRPFQRRRADRRARARRRHGRRLRGHPPHPVADRRARRSTRACTSSACRSSRLAPRADPGRRRGPREAGSDAPVVVGGIIPESDVARCASRRRRRLHAEGLRARASCATSSRSSLSTTASQPPPRSGAEGVASGERAASGVELGRRLRDRDHLRRARGPQPDREPDAGESRGGRRPARGGVPGRAG